MQSRGHRQSFADEPEMQKKPASITIECCACSRVAPNSCDLYVYNFVAGFVSISIAAGVAWLTKMPFVFPSLGPTAFLHFALPDKPPASPKNTILAHLIGVLAGSLALQVTGCYWQPLNIRAVTPERIACAALSVAITNCAMVMFKVPHPPAAATTLIVSLGIITHPIELCVMMGAVTLITIVAFIINRIFRKDKIYPFWAVPKPQQQPVPVVSVDDVEMKPQRKNSKKASIDIQNAMSTMMSLSKSKMLKVGDNEDEGDDTDDNRGDNADDHRGDVDVVRE